MAKKTKAKKQVKRASQAEIAHAEMLYCEKLWTPEAISKELDRDIKTIYAWRDKGEWETTREMFETGPSQLKKILLKEAVRISKGGSLTDENGQPIKPVDADALSKVMKAYDYVNKKAGPEIIRDVFVEFDNFVVTIDPKIAQEFTKFHKMFLHHRISLEG